MENKYKNIRLYMYMGLWLFRVYDYYFGCEDIKLNELRKQLREDAEKNYGLNI